MGNIIAVSIIIDEEEMDDYNNGLGKKLNNLYNIGKIKWVNIIKAHRFIEFGDRFTSFYNYIEENYPDNIIIIYSELFEGICDLDDPDEADRILDAIMAISKMGRVMPSVDFIYDTGSKKYALNDIFKSKMLPDTYVYPNDEKIISKLPKSNYLMKYGYTGESKGVKIANNANGKDIIKELEIVRDMTVDNKPNNFKDQGVACRDNIAIVQPLSNLYNKCYELRFGVLNDDIIGLKIANINMITSNKTKGGSGILDNDELNPIDAAEIWENLEIIPDDLKPFNRNGYDDNAINNYFKNTCTPKRGRSVYVKDGDVVDRNLYYKNDTYSAYAFKINSDIFKFVKNVITDIKRLYPDYIYARIDIIYECHKKNMADFVYDNTINSIYLNEIDTIASGYKDSMSKVIDNGNCGWIHVLRNDKTNNIVDEGVYEKIDEYIINKINNKH